MQTHILTCIPGLGWSQALESIVTDEQTLVLVFGSGPEVDPALAALRATYPKAVIAGCSTAGEIAGTRILDGSVTAAITRFDRTQLAFAQAPLGGSDSMTVGASLARTLRRPDLRAVLVLAEGLGIDGADLAAGLQGGVGADVVVTGGLAADGERFEATWIVVDGERKTSGAIAVGFYGESLRVSHGSRGGWDIFGPTRRVTRSDGNEIFEIDGRPALDLYELYLGDRARDLPGSALLFPVALCVPGRGDERVVRSVLGVDQRARSLRLGGAVPVGSTVQMMRANSERVIESAGEAACATSTESAGLTVAISCIGRRIVLGERTEEELEAAAAMLPHCAPLAGFYSYGEIAPCQPGGMTALHNQTMTLTRYEEI